MAEEGKFNRILFATFGKSTRLHSTYKTSHNRGGLEKSPCKSVGQEENHEKVHEPKWTINRMSKKRLKFQDCEGTKGEKLTVSWMPDNCVRLTFRNCGKTVVTKVFPAKLTNIEVSYNG